MKVGFTILSVFLLVSAHAQQGKARLNYYQSIKGVLGKAVVAWAERAMSEKPVTVTAQTCSRSAGGKHDFYSEGDYWWPNPTSPDSPYIQRDGMTNPNNFVAHRHAMIRLSRIVGTLASAYRVTGNEKYVGKALQHCRAWFTDTATMMNPNLLYAQAIKGRVTGRGVGIIDAIHFMEVVQGLTVMEKARTMDRKTLAGVKQWFASFVDWLTTHPYGKDEMNATNNHATCWAMQVACFAKFTGNQKVMNFCRDRFKTVLLPNQIAVDGSFPRELGRTKPYGYSLFNLDAMTTLAQILSSSKDNLWTFQLSDGRSLKKGIEFLYPYIENKSKWPFKQDVMYWNEWPVAQPALVFGAVAYNNLNWFTTWKGLNQFPEVEEVIRNLPIRNPLLWIGQ